MKYIIPFLLSACVSTSGSEVLRNKEHAGYCFKADGIRKNRCYTSMKACVQRETTLRDSSPWTKITMECQYIP